MSGVGYGAPPAEALDTGRRARRAMGRERDAVAGTGYGRVFLERMISTPIF